MSLTIVGGGRGETHPSARLPIQVNMLVEVVAIVSGSLVAITGLTLRFCSVIDKRERAEQVEDDELRLDRAEPFPHVQIYIEVAEAMPAAGNVLNKRSRTHT